MAEEAAEAEEEFVEKSPRLFQLSVALFHALVSNSELVCYFAMVLNHLVTASILSMFYPVSIFLWAMLSVPRPSKAYWVTVITYTEVGGRVCSVCVLSTWCLLRFSCLLRGFVLHKSLYH